MARSSSSRSGSSSPPSPPDHEPTNTLAVTSLPRPFFQPQILDALRDHFGSFGEINQWVPLQGFARIIIVYEKSQHAEVAKMHSDRIILAGHGNNGSDLVLRVYRADPNPVIPRRQLRKTGRKESWIPDTSYLQPPAIEKNFLISPPGSPPVGWEQIREDPPNVNALAEDLIAALKKLQAREEESKKPVELHDPEEGPANVGVYVEDYDAGQITVIHGTQDSDWVYGETAPAREKWRPLPTAMPPAMST
ncbi:calcineurin-binding protein [Crepidotus variabilis]|uniref:Calcineurin-binding protein n=1 Tax=Crepidotus variabilis TaxID=179855 RepID=A0A9P6EQZ8_9AGAR|nr:calcineurin-binding protein [Crepidotus variabilis]